MNEKRTVSTSKADIVNCDLLAGLDEKINPKNPHKFGRRDMGMKDHPINNKEIVFPRSFRFTFHPESNNDLHWRVTKVNVDYVSRRIALALYELDDLSTHEWLTYLLGKKAKETVTIRTYDGCGNELYSLKFKNIKLESHYVPYNYASSEAVTHRITLTFDGVEAIKPTKPDKVADIFCK